VAGAFVELSVNGGSWTQITPSRGYDYRFFSNNRDLNGRWIFTTAALQPAPPEWESLTFDLSPYQGGAVVRFRLFSTDVTSKGTGWWIDNIRVESADTPVRLAAFSAARTEEGVALAWRLSGEDDLSGIAVSRKAEGEESFRRLNDALLPATTSGTFVDTHAPENQALLYRLAAVRRDGTPVELGQVTAPGAGTSPVLRLAAHPNPARGPVVFEFNAPAASPVRLTLFDASGRPVRRLVDGLIEPGEHRISWDGLDGGGVPVPAGVYFYRLERGAAADTRKLVIAR
jgi:hypothetical protein